MSNQDNRIIPPGQFGSPFLEPSLSMRYDGGEPVTDFFDMRARGGTVASVALAAALAEHFPGDGAERYTIVISDGDPLAELPEGERQQTLVDLIASLKPGETLVCLDQSGAQPDTLGLNCKLLVIAGNGLLPVPSAQELVTRACATVDGAVSADDDQCCGCGGCDKNKS